AEPDVVSREHDAVGRGAVEALRLVGRALERADLARPLHRGEELRLPLLLAPEEGVDRGGRGARVEKLLPLRLHGPALRLEGLLFPRRRDPRPGLAEVLPL